MIRERGGDWQSQHSEFCKAPLACSDDSDGHSQLTDTAPSERKKTKEVNI